MVGLLPESGEWVHAKAINDMSAVLLTHLLPQFTNCDKLYMVRELVY